jgi:hypothetical protein
MQRRRQQPDEQGIDRRQRLSPDSLRQIRSGMDVRRRGIPISGRGSMNDIVNRLRTNRECLAPCLMDEAADTIERLRAERDEARRMVCGLDADIMEDQIEYAKHRGWDCFKEETGGTQKTRDAGIR